MDSLTRRLIDVIEGAQPIDAMSALVSVLALVHTKGAGLPITKQTLAARAEMINCALRLSVAEIS